MKQLLLWALIAHVAWGAQPNIIFFLSDDHPADLLGCAGHPVLKTPTIDALAARGVRFENSFVSTSICAASRATLFTGLYERSHQYTFGTLPIRKSQTELSYPRLLRDAGYRTGFVGKFGVGVEGGEQHKMFDSYVPLNRSPYHKKQADGSTRHVTEIAGDKAIEFIQQQSDTPFCLSVSFNAAHAEDGDKKNHFPWPKAEDGLYDDIDIPAPRLGDPKIFDSQPEFLRTSMNRDRWFWRWDTPEKYQRNIRAYFRMITGLDRVMGRVLKAVEEAGQLDNTVVIFMGDNGYYKGDRGFAGKWSHYEQSLRVPLVIADPRVPAAKHGRTPSAIVANVDIAATIVSYAGLTVPASYQGHNLAPYVSGTSEAAVRDDFFCEHLMNNGSIPKWEGVRGSRYVYARYFQQQPIFEFLHDLEKDPDQLTNLADNPEYAAILKRMQSRCDTLRDGYGGVWTGERLRGRKQK